MKQVMIVDDEQDARYLIKQYLDNYPNFKIIGEADNGISAVEKINNLRPDIVFLDIQMPGLNGFEVLTQIDCFPAIVFTTAYDKYALKAFEVHALDYLLKPYGKSRFMKAIARIEDNNQKVELLAEQLLEKNRDYPAKVIVHKGRKKFFIAIKDILYFTAFGDYTKVFTRQEEYLSTSGISCIEAKLNPTDFVRIHRSHLINLTQVQELQKRGRYYYLLIPGLAPFKISDTYLPIIKNRYL